MRIDLERSKWNIGVCLLATIALYGVTTLSYTLWPGPVSPNRVLGFFIFLELAALYAQTLRRRDLAVLMVCFLSCGVSFAFCADFSQNLTDAVYFAATVLLLWKLADYETACALFCALERLRGFLWVTAAAGNFLLLLGFFFPSSYTRLWGASAYYQGFTNSTHTLCAGACLLLAFTLFLLKDAAFRLWQPLLFVPGVLAVAMSGARTYLVSALSLVLLYILYETPRTKLRLALIPVLILLTAYLALFSGMAAKYEFLRGSTALSETALARLTSGRTEFWALDLNAFLEFDFLHLLLGRGFDFVYALNEAAYGVRIWAHCDVLDLLLSAGLLGLALYGFVIFAVLWTVAKRTAGSLLPSLLFLYLLFVLLVNGFFGYQHYVYSFAVLVLTFMGAPDTRGGEGVGDDCLEYHRAGL